MKNFAIIGVAGYVAPRHLQAIKDTGNKLVAAMDPNDSVGILDRFFPESSFFTEFERFDRHIAKAQMGETPVDYVSICSPNHLHDAHIRFALNQNCDAICEKPLVLNPWNLETLEKKSKETGHQVYTILQLRLHPAILALKQKVDETPGKRFQVELTYITSRGKWYDYSWKGDESKSGGIATNIGVHFFDMLLWVFGGVRSSKVHLLDQHAASGALELEQADVRWFLSIDSEHLPDSSEGPTFRHVKVDDESVEFSTGFTDLHTLSYQEVLEGRGFGIQTVVPSIELVHQIRTSQEDSAKGDFHPMLKNRGK